MLTAVIVDVAVYADGCRAEKQATLEAAIAAGKDIPGGFVWIGLHEPTPDEFDTVARELGLHELAVEDAVHAHQRPKVEVYGESLFVVLKTATYVDPDEVIHLGEIMLFIGHSFVVSVRHGDHTALSETRLVLEGEGDRLAQGPSAVLHAVVDRVVDGYEVALHGLDVDIDEIEHEVFGGNGGNHAERIYKLKREVLDFRRAVRPLVDPLDNLAHGRTPLIDADLGHWFRDVHDHVLRVAEQIDAFDNLLDGALDANLAQVGVRQNEDMRKISAWVAIAAVPTMVAGIYGMNFEHMPELDEPWAYPAVLVFLVIACVGLFFNFKRRGWL